MADAEQQDNTSQQNTQNSGGNKVEQELAKVQEQLQAMNRLYEAQSAAIANMAKPQTRQADPIIEDDDFYDAKKLNAKVTQTSKAIASEIVARERELNATIYNLAQEYPEIQTNAEIRSAVVAAHDSVPESLRGSAVGYEMAVLKAVSKAGIIAKSKRKETSVDDDISSGGGSSGGSSSSGRAPKKKVVTDKMLALAELLGRDIKDKNVLKGLEEAANRDTYSKYR